jgi:hypothetical protein
VVAYGSWLVGVLFECVWVWVGGAQRCVHLCRCVGYGSGVWVRVCGCAAPGLVWVAGMGVSGLEQCCGTWAGAMLCV